MYIIFEIDGKIIYINILIQGGKRVLGENIKRLRQSNQYSQEKLAEKLGVSRQAIAKWENGDTSPDLTNFVEIARLFQVTLDDLVNYSENEYGLGVPPQGKHIFGSVKIDHNRCIELPEKAMTVLNLHIGDELLVLGDEGEGVALVKKDEFLKKMQDLFNIVQDK